MAVSLLESYFDFFYAMAIKEKLKEVLIRPCDGCLLNSLSQTDHICVNRPNRETIEIYFDDILKQIDEQEILFKWESSVHHIRDTELVHMYKLKIFCLDWRECDMKTSSWKRRMIQLTLQLMRIDKRCLF